MADPETIGGKIKRCRKEAKLTQERLAELVNISPTYLSEIETNRKQPGRRVLCAIAEALDVSVDYLLYYHDQHDGNIKMNEWKILLEDCSTYEKNVLFELAGSTKGILRKNSNLFHEK